MELKPGPDRSACNRKLLWAAALLWMVSFACRPIITVGWAEILILAGVILFALAPFLLRVYRAYLGIEDDSEDKKQK